MSFYTGPLPRHTFGHLHSQTSWQGQIWRRPRRQITTVPGLGSQGRGGLLRWPTTARRNITANVPEENWSGISWSTNNCQHTTTWNKYSNERMHMEDSVSSASTYLPYRLARKRWSTLVTGKRMKSRNSNPALSMVCHIYSSGGFRCAKWDMYLNRAIQFGAWWTLEKGAWWQCSL